MNAITKDLSFCGIYMIVNVINNHRYIGSSVNIKRRLEIHRANLRHNNHDNLHLQNAWNKYGENNFIFSVLESCPKDSRFIREQYYVDTLKPEYNICLDVVQNPPTSEESRLKQSNTRKRLMAQGVIPITNNTPVYVYYKDGTFVGNWKSIRQAAEALGIHYSSVCRCVQGHDFQTKGYRFFKEEQKSVSPFTKPKSLGYKKQKFIVTDTFTGNTLSFVGRDQVAKYFGTTTKTIGIYVGGKHKLKKRYMIHRDTAV